MPWSLRERGGSRWAGVVALLLGGLLMFVQPLDAQESDETAVLEVVDRLFEGMRAADSAEVRAVLHPEARIVSTGERNDKPVVQYSSTEGFIQAVGGATVPWNERIYAPEVRIEDNLATVWAFYTFHAGDQFSHCGINAIQLARTDVGWRVIHLADTRRREPCDPPDER